MYLIQDNLDHVALTGRNESFSRVGPLVPLIHRNSGSLRSWWIKGLHKSWSRVDSVVLLMHHDSGSLGLWRIDRLHELSLRVEALAPLMHHHAGSLGSWCIYSTNSMNYCQKRNHWFLWCTMIQDHLDVGISTTPSNPCAEWIHWFLWCARTQMIFGHKVWSRSSQRNTPLLWLIIKSKDKVCLQGWLGMEGDPPARDNVCSYKQNLWSLSGPWTRVSPWDRSGWARLKLSVHC